MKYIIRNLIKGEYDKWRKFATDLLTKNIDKKLDYGKLRSDLMLIIYQTKLKSLILTIKN